MSHSFDNCKWPFTPFLPLCTFSVMSIKLKIYMYFAAVNFHCYRDETMQTEQPSCWENLDNSRKGREREIQREREMRCYLLLFPPYDLMTWQEQWFSGTSSLDVSSQRSSCWMHCLIWAWLSPLDCTLYLVETVDHRYQSITLSVGHKLTIINNITKVYRIDSFTQNGYVSYNQAIIFQCTEWSCHHYST